MASTNPHETSIKEEQYKTRKTQGHWHNEIAFLLAISRTLHFLIDSLSYIKTRFVAVIDVSTCRVRQSHTWIENDEWIQGPQPSHYFSLSACKGG